MVDGPRVSGFSLLLVTPEDGSTELKQLPPDGVHNEKTDGSSGGGEVRLQRSMGLWSGVSIIVGSIIGKECGRIRTYISSPLFNTIHLLSY